MSACKLAILFVISRILFVFSIALNSSTYIEHPKNSSDEKYKAIIENSVHAFFLATPEGLILDANKAAETLFEYSKDELLHMKRTDLIDESDPDFYRAMEKRKREGYVSAEAIAIKKNGQRFFIEFSSAFFIDTDDNLKVSTLVTDITERKKAETELLKEVERNQLISQATNDAIWDWDVIENNIWGNEVYKTLIGATTFQQFSEKLHPEDRKRVDSNFAEARKNHRSMIREEFRCMTTDGTYRVFFDRAYMLYDSSGKLYRMSGAMQDITERKKTESLLHESEERYRYLFNNNPANIFIWDSETLQILEVNEAAVHTYGYSREEFQHLKVTDLVADNRKDNSGLRRHLNSKGSIILMEMSYHEINYKGLKAILALGQDVTEKTLLENSLAEERQIRQKQITDAVITGQEKERSQLGEELHDNINQILATTRLYIECAISDEHPRPDLIKESKILLERAMYEIRQLSKTLLPPSLGEIGLLDALNELIVSMRETSIFEIESDWKGFDEDELNDKLKLTIFRIVQEQMTNISKHSQATKATVSLKKENDTIILKIIDNGIGFSPALKKSGLGLRNMTSRAEVNNGILTIESRPGRGCTITVVFN